MPYNPDGYPAQSGDLIDEDGSVKNVVTLLGGGSPLSDQVYPQKPAKSGRVIGEDGKLYSLIELFQNSSGGKDIPDGGVTLAKLAQEVLTRIDQHKFTPLSGSTNDADQLLETGIYFNIGGYGLLHAPRNNYGWMLIVSRGVSNGHPRGAQVYFDHDGFDWRGYEGDSFTDWQTCIIKNAMEGIEPIDDPSSATAEDVAEAFNALLAALKG